MIEVMSFGLLISAYTFFYTMTLSCISNREAPRHR
jgi:hypothetical protein